MSILNSNLQQSLLLAGTLSLTGGLASAQTSTSPSAVPMPGVGAAPSASASAVNPEGRAGIATLCIEKRSYVDYEAKKIVTPTIYIETMPKEGINTGYVEGNAIAKQWEDFLNPKDEARKKWLEDTDIPDQAEAAIKLVKRLDKNKDGIITPEEFEAGEHGASPEDRKIDLAFLTSLRCDNLYFTEGAKNTVDVDAFPEVVTLKNDLTTTQSSYSGLKLTHASTLSTLAAEQDKSKKILYTAIGLGGLSVLLGVGLVVALRRKKPDDSDPKGKTPKQTPPPLPKTPTKEGPASKAEAAVKTGGNYDDVMKAIEDDGAKGKGEVDPNVLAALSDETPGTQQETDQEAMKDNQHEQKPAQVDPKPDLGAKEK